MVCKIGGIFMKKNIFNFYHKLPIGRYPIDGGFLEITSEHVENLQKKEGALETAILEFEEEKKGVFFFENSSKTCFDDVCLYLSLLTDRKVSWNPKEILLSFHGDCDPVADINFLHECFPKSFDVFKTKSLVNAFWCAANYCFYPALEVKAYYASSCINKLYDYYCSEKEERFPKGFINRLIDYIKRSVDDFPVSGEEKKYLEDVKERLDIKRDLSAVYKTEFFCSNCIMKRLLSDEEKNRLKLLNKVRNSFVHNAANLVDKIPKKPNLTEDRILDISVACVVITKYMCDYFLLVNVLGLDEILLSSMKRSIVQFVESGEFNGVKVFEESFEDFFKRKEIDC